MHPPKQCESFGIDRLVPPCARDVCVCAEMQNIECAASPSVKGMVITQPPVLSACCLNSCIYVSRLVARLVG